MRPSDKEVGWLTVAKPKTLTILRNFPYLAFKDCGEAAAPQRAELPELHLACHAATESPGYR